MVALFVEDLHERLRELVRDILELADYVESGPVDSEYVARKAEEFTEIVN